MILDGLYDPSHRKKLSFDEAAANVERNVKKYVYRWFGQDPDLYYYNNYDNIIAAIKEAPGLKLRVPLEDLRTALPLAKSLSVFCDHVVFSPAPMWPSCNQSLAHHFPEFSTKGSFSPSPGRPVPGDYERLNRHLDHTTYYAGLIALRPLVESGLVSYLPQRGWSLCRWDYRPLGLPDVPEPYRTNKDDEGIVGQALVGLFLENFVSSQLGCYHHLPFMSTEEGFSDGLAAEDDGQQVPLALPYILLRLRVPYLENVSYWDLASIRKDHHELFARVKDSLLIALAQAARDTRSGADPEAVIARVQKEVIDEPVRQLREKLDRITKYRSMQMAGLALGSVAVAVTSVLGQNIFGVSSYVLGGINLFKIYETYLKYLEDRAPLRSESAFYLMRLIDKGRKGCKK